MISKLKLVHAFGDCPEYYNSGHLVMLERKYAIILLVKADVDPISGLDAACHNALM